MVSTQLLGTLADCDDGPLLRRRSHPPRLKNLPAARSLRASANLRKLSNYGDSRGRTPRVMRSPCFVCTLARRFRLRNRAGSLGLSAALADAPLSLLARTLRLTWRS